jgi:3,5-epimerase/4-reductase
MKWLLYGSRGWIGRQVVDLLRGEDVVEGHARADQMDDVMREITEVKPDRVICTIGRIMGPNCPNIDYLEQQGKLVENLRDNLQGPLNLADVCQQLGIHLTYLGTGCIYEYNETHPMSNPTQLGYTEEDKPNFTGSQYSAVKGMTDQLIRRYKTALNVRIRMPIANDFTHPHDFVTKILHYPKIISIPNSMSYLPELLPIMLDLARNKVIGTVNLTNPGVITHAEILDLYQLYIDPSYKYQIMDLAELERHTKSRRSNNYLDTTKLERMYPRVRHIREAVTQMFIDQGVSTS